MEDIPLELHERLDAILDRSVQYDMHTGQSVTVIDKIRNDREQPAGDGRVRDRDTREIIGDGSPYDSNFFDVKLRQQMFINNHPDTPFMTILAGETNRNVMDLADDIPLMQILRQEENVRKTLDIERARLNVDATKKAEQIKAMEEVVSKTRTQLNHIIEDKRQSANFYRTFRLLACYVGTGEGKNIGFLLPFHLQNEYFTLKALIMSFLVNLRPDVETIDMETWTKLKDYAKLDEFIFLPTNTPIGRFFDAVRQRLFIDLLIDIPNPPLLEDAAAGFAIYIFVRDILARREGIILQSDFNGTDSNDQDPSYDKFVTNGLIRRLQFYAGLGVRFAPSVENKDEFGVAQSERPYNNGPAVLLKNIKYFYGGYQDIPLPAAFERVIGEFDERNDNSHLDVFDTIKRLFGIDITRGEELIRFRDGARFIDDYSELFDFLSNVILERGDLESNSQLTQLESFTRVNPARPDGADILTRLVIIDDLHRDLLIDGEAGIPGVEIREPRGFEDDEFEEDEMSLEILYNESLNGLFTLKDLLATTLLLRALVSAPIAAFMRDLTDIHVFNVPQFAPRTEIDPSITSTREMATMMRLIWTTRRDFIIRMPDGSLGNNDIIMFNTLRNLFAITDEAKANINNGEIKRSTDAKERLDRLVNELKYISDYLLPFWLFTAYQSLTSYFGTIEPSDDLVTSPFPISVDSDFQIFLTTPQSRQLPTDYRYDEEIWFKISPHRFPIADLPVILNALIKYASTQRTNTLTLRISKEMETIETAKVEMERIVSGQPKPGSLWDTSKNLFIPDARYQSTPLASGIIFWKPNVVSAMATAQLQVYNKYCDVIPEDLLTMESLTDTTNHHLLAVAFASFAAMMMANTTIPFAEQYKTTKQMQLIRTNLGSKINDVGRELMNIVSPPRTVGPSAKRRRLVY